MVMRMKVKSNIGKLIDESPYKREYIRKHFNKSRNTISNWCTGKSYPSVPELFELAALLKLKVDDLYEQVETAD
ncbi:helix-turn-helix transcriptional regulator [Bacillus sp. JJ1773]|uniref:helix-turn-helix transcriptional regulator n=1 Tax=Bacillus sp. JJ1773 TaxID=3122965 RepID=UPI002FFDBDE0